MKRFLVLPLVLLLAGCFGSKEIVYRDVYILYNDLCNVRQKMTVELYFYKSRIHTGDKDNL